jgi:hypothetical protein
MKMTGSLLVAAMWTLRPTLAFFCASSTRSAVVSKSRASISSRHATRLLATSASTQLAVESGVSRLSTLQTLLNKHGAPGSQGCNTADDLVAVTMTLQDTPELVASLDNGNFLRDLHPYLFPIAKSQSTGNYICAYRSPYVEDGQQDSPPWPIVETKLGGPGMQLLALNSEHMMRRIACECDEVGGNDNSVIDIYNEALGKGFLADALLDTKYEAGSVAKLGYGVEKYVLLRVGPFPDLYQSMALQHAERNDVQSSLIAAETSSSKHIGFGSTFLFYSRLLKSFPSRDDEARDSARMCLRMPLPTLGMTLEDFKEVAILAQVADAEDSVEEAVAKLKGMYFKIRTAEREDDYQQGMTPEQMAIDDANHRLDVAAFTGEAWSEVRPELGEKFRAVGRDDMAAFIDR